MTNDHNKAIWIVDDDTEDHELIREIFAEMKWNYHVELFTGGDELLRRMDEVDVAPFVIITDVNLPKMDGFELREKTLKSSNNKFHSVPFIFWSTRASEAQIRKAYRLNAHGFFVKEAQLEEWKSSFIRIVEYWSRSLVPSKEDKPDAPLR